MENNALVMQNLSQSLATAQQIISKDYYERLTSLKVVELPEHLRNVVAKDCTWLFKLKKVIYSKGEDTIGKLTTIANILYGNDSTLVIIVDCKDGKTSFYIGVVNKNSGMDLNTMASSLQSGIQGNFHGSDLEELGAEDVNARIKSIFNNKFESQCITSISGIASKRDYDSEIKEYIQGIENMMDALSGTSFTLITIADPIGHQEIRAMRMGYETLYSQLSPMAKTDISYQQGDSVAITDSETVGLSKSISSSVSMTQSHTTTNGWSTGETEGESRLRRISPAGAFAGIATTLATGGISAPFLIASLGNTSRTYSSNVTGGESDAQSSGTVFGETSTDSRQKGKSNTRTYNIGSSMQMSFENRTIKTLLVDIDKHLERLKQCENYGMFNYCTYIISSNAGTNKIVANSYHSLMRGESSSLQTSYINTWTKEKDVSDIKGYLGKFTHPMFSLNESEFVTPATVVGGQELAIHMAFPKKSISGLPVVECAAFGREIAYQSQAPVAKTLQLGCIQHMGIDEPAHPVWLDLQSLASHTFITGTNGSGKSNANYKILKEAREKNIPFLVIEPAKGEYKHVFGNDPGVSVFGTNPLKMPILRINPFKFPDDIHVLEHIDRVIEIFNACWPMYAAMPAVLKESIERAYTRVGWDLELSVNNGYPGMFPTFADVLVELERVVRQSAFSEELKSNYIGALATRIKSLTNGIFSRIFTSNEISSSVLFDSNVVVDLSRIGSVETKAMIMGILVMRLQEYRMTQEGMNRPLKHLTVLEEAHNLLRRTSLEQSSEGSNLLGKSVEMLSNSIAEMRTYGEGFIIVDQSPGLLDLSVIRNTNTKIILRLPDLSDRELVGKAAGLNENQIAELSRLKTGVAVIYQNNWVEPVLCHADKAGVAEMPYNGEPETNNTAYFILLKKDIIYALLAPYADDDREKADNHIDRLIDKISSANYVNVLKIELIKELRHGSRDRDNVARLISGLFETDSIFINARNASSLEQWNKLLLSGAGEVVLHMDEEHRNSVLDCLIKAKSLEDPSLHIMYQLWSEKMRRF